VGNPAPYQPSEDKTLPTEYQGTLPPNYFCRGWNPKREKYCGARAGAKTDHKGVGRCKWHDGGRPKHGRYSTTTRARLAPLIERFEGESPEEALDIFPELATARALLHDWLDRFEEYVEALEAWNSAEYAEKGPRARPVRIPEIHELAPLLDLISKMVERWHKAASINSIPRRRFLDLMTETGRILNEEITRPEDLERVKARMRELRL
jgi:hypothetical protein